MLITILAMAVVLGVLIFVHELGHFMTAKAADIEVPRFSIGFGPRVIGFKRGETEYVISALPLGGYVKMAGMEEMEMIEGPDAEAAEATDAGPRQPRPRDFDSKPLGWRALVISAGVLMNLLFAFVVFSVIGLVWGVPAPPPPLIGDIAEERLPPGAESLAGIPRGARIIAFDGDPVSDFEQLQLALTTAGDGPATLQLENGEVYEFTLPERDSLRISLISAFVPVADIAPVLNSITPDSPADRAGLERGDVVVRVGGDTARSWQDLTGVLETRSGQPVDLVVLRGDQRIEITVTPEAHTLPGGLTYGRIGAGSLGGQFALPRDRVGPVRAVAWGATETWKWIELTLSFLGGMFTGEQSVRELGGPITIGQISGQVARAGLESFLNFMALLSVNLAILNLLPIPVLDGGHLVFLGIEAVRGRALSFKQRMRLSQVGFVLILMIMAFAIGNDILRLFGL
jgi:regulator of sigma E protease